MIRSKGYKYQSRKVKEMMLKNGNYFKNSKNSIREEFEWADYVIGLNSTSVVEALALGKILICPAWSEIYNHSQLKQKGFLYDLEETVIWAKSKNDFFNLLDSILLGEFEHGNKNIKLRLDKANQFVNSYSYEEKLVYGNWLRKISS